MGWMVVHCFCVNCATLIAVNPNTCPSLVVDGKREPLCRACFDRWNQIHRIDKGLPPFKLDPTAYDPAPAD